MANIFVNILNDDTQNYPFSSENKCLKRLDTKFNKFTIQKVPKVVKPTNKKTLL